MAPDVSRDQFVLIKIEGMHSHKCEKIIQKALNGWPGVHEVEIDFNSRQASVLFDGEIVTIEQLMDTVSRTGYRVTGFTKSEHVSE